jgi:GTP-binding protein
MNTMQAIMNMPKPVVRPNSPLQILTANIDYDDFKGKLGIGRVHSGSIKRGQQVGVTRPGEPVKTSKVSELFVFDNLGRMAVEEASAGDIVMIAGITEIGIGDTVVDPANPIAMVRTLNAQYLLPVKVSVLVLVKVAHTAAAVKL